MKFSEFIQIDEAGQFTMDIPKSFRVLFQGKIIPVSDVQHIDPKFEFHNLPPTEGSKMKKFLGESPFSLPIFSPQGTISGYIVSDNRSSMLAGRGHLSNKPEGYLNIPKDWADRATIMDSENNDLLSNYRMTTVGGPIAQAAGVTPQLAK